MTTQRTEDTQSDAVATQDQQTGGQVAEPIEEANLDSLFVDQAADPTVEKPSAEVTLNKPRTWGEEASE